MVRYSEVYSEPCQTLLKVVNYFAKRSILDIWQGSEYASGIDQCFPELFSE